jgi:hypothetical protein
MTWILYAAEAVEVAFLHQVPGEGGQPERWSSCGEEKGSWHQPAFINRRFGYKVGVLVGLGLAAVGGFLFLPASQALTYGAFLAALFVLAAGLSIP